MNRLFSEIPVGTSSTEATVYFNGSMFAKVDITKLPLPTKHYNIVLLAIEKFIDVDVDPGDKIMLEAANEPFSNLLKLMHSLLEKDEIEKMILENPILEPFTVKLH